ncbi:MAG: DinB family protein [Candidatus Rokubacteria bacterium]|nr:DinB family protein [Candidatus Rokubacteria bacterium]
MMENVATLDMIRGLYDYHRWANRRLFEVAATLGEEAAGREVGKQFSFSTVRRMFAHIYGADWIWLMRWKGTSPTKLPGGEIGSLATLREKRDALEKEQQAFIEALTPADLARVIDYTQVDGQPFRSPLWQMLQHVANHATHHRSEIATMLTMVQGSPPDTGLMTYQRMMSGQQGA